MNLCYMMYTGSEPIPSVIYSTLFLEYFFRTVEWCLYIYFEVYIYSGIYIYTM